MLKIMSPGPLLRIMILPVQAQSTVNIKVGPVLRTRPTKTKNIKACRNVNDYGYAVTDSVGLR